MDECGRISKLLAWSSYIVIPCNPSVCFVIEGKYKPIECVRRIFFLVSHGRALLSLLSHDATVRQTGAADVLLFCSLLRSPEVCLSLVSGVASEPTSHGFGLRYAGKQI